MVCNRLEGICDDLGCLTVMSHVLNVCYTALFGKAAKTLGETMKSLFTLAIGTMTVLSSGFASQAQQYKQTNLVSSTSGIAPVTDPALVDPWGLSRASDLAVDF
jgi:hypothetical protein